MSTTNFLTDPIISCVNDGECDLVIRKISAHLKERLIEAGGGQGTSIDCHQNPRGSLYVVCDSHLAQWVDGAFVLSIGRPLNFLSAEEARVFAQLLSALVDECEYVTNFLKANNCLPLLGIFEEETDV